MGGVDNAVDLPILHRAKIPELAKYGKMIDDIFRLFSTSTPDDYEYSLVTDFFDTADGEVKDVYENVVRFYQDKGIYE